MTKINENTEIKGKLHRIGQLIRKYREYSFVSRDYINEEYNFSRSLLERLEFGENVTLKTLLRIAEILEIRMSELFEDFENFENEK